MFLQRLFKRFLSKQADSKEDFANPFAHNHLTGMDHGTDDERDEDFDEEFDEEDEESEDGQTVNPATHISTLGEREESAGEMASRSPDSRGWFESILILIAFALLWLTGNHDKNQFWFFLAGALYFLRVLLRFFSPKTSLAPKRVELAEGRFTARSMSEGLHTAHTYNAFYLGEFTPLIVPRHWLAYLHHYIDKHVEVAFRKSDGTLLKIGKELSIDMEETLFPSRPTRWMRPLLLSMVGIFSLILSVCFIRSFTEDLVYARAALWFGEPVKIHDMKEILAQPPALGSMVRIKAETRCQIRISETHQNTGNTLPKNAPPIDCSTVRWGGNPLQVDDVSLPAMLGLLDSGQLLAAQRLPDSGTFRQLLYHRSRGNNLDRYRHETLYILDHLPELIAVAGHFCTSNADPIQTACEAFKEKLLRSIFNDVRPPDMVDWQELAQSARDRSISVNSEKIETLRGLIQKMVESEIKALYTAPFQKLLQSQQGGILLRLPNTTAAALAEQLASQSEGWVIANSLTTGEGATGWGKQWHAYQRLAHPENLIPILQEGFVVQHGKNAAGDIELHIESNTDAGKARRALLRIIALASALLLTAFSLPVCIIRINRAIARKKAIKAYYETRSLDFM